MLLLCGAYAPKVAYSSTRLLHLPLRPHQGSREEAGGEAEARRPRASEDGHGQVSHDT